MTESWRNILERAAENLSIELDQMATPAFSHAHAASFGSRRLSPQLSFAESRELLARELQAFSAQSRRERPAEPRMHSSTALTVPVTRSSPKVEPVRTHSQKGTPWQNLFATLLSAVITGGLTGYILLAQGDFGKDEGLASAAYASVGAYDSQPVTSKNSAAVVNRSTEDALMDRASYQLKHGDGEGGRSVLEVLAGHGSVRAAFALAETYDPNALAQHKEWGLNSDLGLARTWYKKASELGSLPAYERLKTLDKRVASR